MGGGSLFQEATFLGQNRWVAPNLSHKKIHMISPSLPQGTHRKKKRPDRTLLPRNSRIKAIPTHPPAQGSV